MENSEGAKLVVDQVQTQLETVYGLQGLRLERAADCLWPDRTSAVLDRVIDSDIKDGLFRAVFVTDYSIRSARPSLRDRIRFSRLARPRFRDYHPAIYLAGDVAAATDGVQCLPEMLSPDRLKFLDMISEEVGHFVYHHTQFNLYRQFPDLVMSEAMGLLDIYQVMRGVCFDVGTDINDPDQADSVRVSDYIQAKRDRYLNITGELSYYRESEFLIGGYLDHLKSQDSSNGESNAKIQRFYKSPLSEKVNFLYQLYSRLVAEGQESYLSDRISVELYGSRHLPKLPHPPMFFQGR